jgi:hypothetical protein
MTINYKICDVKNCRSKAKRYCFWVDRRMDAAGDMDDDFEYVDLCKEHKPDFNCNRENKYKARDFFLEVKKSLDLDKYFHTKCGE